MLRRGAPHAQRHQRRQHGALGIRLLLALPRRGEGRVVTKVRRRQPAQPARRQGDPDPAAHDLVDCCAVDLFASTQRQRRLTRLARAVGVSILVVSCTVGGRLLARGGGGLGVGGLGVEDKGEEEAALVRHAVGDAALDHLPDAVARRRVRLPDGTERRAQLRRRHEAARRAEKRDDHAGVAHLGDDAMGEERTVVGRRDGGRGRRGGDGIVEGGDAQQQRRDERRFEREQEFLLAHVVGEDDALTLLAHLERPVRLGENRLGHVRRRHRPRHARRQAQPRAPLARLDDRRLEHAPNRHVSVREDRDLAVLAALARRLVARRGAAVAHQPPLEILCACDDHLHLIADAHRLGERLRLGLLLVGRHRLGQETTHWHHRLGIVAVAVAVVVHRIRGGGLASVDAVAPHNDTVRRHGVDARGEHRARSDGARRRVRLASADVRQQREAKSLLGRIEPQQTRRHLGPLGVRVGRRRRVITLAAAAQLLAALLCPRVGLLEPRGEPARQVVEADRAGEVGGKREPDAVGQQRRHLGAKEHPGRHLLHRHRLRRRERLRRHLVQRLKLRGLTRRRLRRSRAKHGPPTLRGAARPPLAVQERRASRAGAHQPAILLLRLDRRPHERTGAEPRRGRGLERRALHEREPQRQLGGSALAALVDVWDGRRRDDADEQLANLEELAQVGCLLELARRERRVQLVRDVVGRDRAAQLARQLNGELAGAHVAHRAEHAQTDRQVGGAQHVGTRDVVARVERANDHVLLRLGCGGCLLFALGRLPLAMLLLGHKVAPRVELRLATLERRNCRAAATREGHIVVVGPAGLGGGGGGGRRGRLL